ncbi:diaminopimelate decarboxylase [uncultured Friedmanniella sp.]|uniref:diaminopimelate decarboxylase n=1 Tax=uncultured Friedmanniella sp. TaxID=335381 RepID=UPI0035CAA013
MTHTHVAGSIHADATSRAPGWLAVPEDVNALLPRLWSQTVSKDADGVLQVGGMSVLDLAEQVGTPVYVVDEVDLRARARAFAEAFAGWEVYYAAKSFLCTAVARWVSEEGLGIDVCTGGELAVAQRAGVDLRRVGLHGNNKSVAELRQGLSAGVGRIIVDSFDEIARLEALAGELGIRARVMVRVTTGVEAHTHEYIATAHEDQKFGFSIAGGQAAAALAACAGAEWLDLVGIHSHIGSQIFEPDGFEVAARRTLRLHADFARSTGTELPELDLGGGFGIAYTSADTPSTPQALATALRGIIEAECAALGVAVPHLSIEPGRAISGPSAFALYRVGTVKQVLLDGGTSRLYVAVDGGMSDNIRTALYAAEYSATVANRRSDAPPAIARVVGRHCEGGDILVRDEFLPADVAPGDLVAVPASGAYSRSMASNYNHVPRPPVVAVRDGEVCTLVRRETIEDLLALDVG